MSIMSLVSQTESLFAKIYPSFKNFPRFEIPGMVFFIKQNFINFLATLRLASRVKSKRIQYLIEADVHLQQVKTCFQMSAKLKYISKSFYLKLQEELEKITFQLSYLFKADIVK